MSDLLTADNLFEILCAHRFFIYETRTHNKSQKPWKLYECCPEEGEDVKKRLAQFDTEEEALKALTATRDKFVRNLNAVFKLTYQRKNKNKSKDVDSRKETME